MTHPVEEEEVRACGVRATKEGLCFSLFLSDECELSCVSVICFVLKDICHTAPELRVR